MTVETKRVRYLPTINRETREKLTNYQVATALCHLHRRNRGRLEIGSSSNTCRVVRPNALVDKSTKCDGVESIRKQGIAASEQFCCVNYPTYICMYYISLLFVMHRLHYTLLRDDTTHYLLKHSLRSAPGCSMNVML